MDWIDRLNSAVSYIEEHLTEDIDYGRLGQIACCSSYHFQKMFCYMTDMPLSEYIRRRRMSLAAVDIMNGMKVIDAAVKYGYDSPTAFNRAFRSVHGAAPSALKKTGTNIVSFPPVAFRITIKGAVDMNYRIETKEAFRMVGISMKLARDIEENHRMIPKKWEEVNKDGTIRKLIDIMDSEPKGILGACIGDSPEDSDKWTYYIGAASTRSLEGMDEYTVPAATWAIFTGSGTGVSIQQLEQRIYSEWFPISGYDHDASVSAEIEVYLDDDPVNMHYEVWIPVTAKKN